MQAPSRLEHDPPSASVTQTVIQPHREAPTRPSGRERGVTFRVVVISLILAAVLGYAIPVIDYKIFNTFLDAQHLPPGAVGALLILVLVVNPLLRLMSKRMGLSRNEALTVYITCLFSSLLPGHGAENFVIPNLIAPFYFHTTSNKWRDALLPYVQPWFTPAVTSNHQYNYSVVEPWYTGMGSSGTIPWQAWIPPLIAWISLVLASYIMLGCLSIILRAQWAEHEALAFPLLRLPLQITEDMDRPDQYGTLGRFFRNPVTWIGFSIAVFIQTLRGLNVYYPDVPTFPLDVNVGPLMSDPPWNQIQWYSLVIYPIAVGISFLLTSEVSFSIWFFMWFMKFQYIAAYYLGFPPNSLPGPGSFPKRFLRDFSRAVVTSPTSLS